MCCSEDSSICSVLCRYIPVYSLLSLYLCIGIVKTRKHGGREDSTKVGMLQFYGAPDPPESHHILSDYKGRLMITVVSFSVKIDFNLKIASQMLDLVNHSTTTDLLEITNVFNC